MTSRTADSDVFYRATLCHSAVYAVVVFLSVRLFVCLSVCPSAISQRSTKTAKHRMKHINNATIAQGLTDTKDLGKIRTGSPPKGHQMQAGLVKIGDFRQITRYNSKTVQDRRIVTIKVE